MLHSFLVMFLSFRNTNGVCFLVFLYVVVQKRPCYPIANHRSHPLGVTVHLEPHPPKDRRVLVKERGHEVSTSAPTPSTATPATSGPTARDSTPESYVSHSYSLWTSVKFSNRFYNSSESHHMFILMRSLYINTSLFP